jgi:HAD superfamily hydrolase (TIGR01509 family)
MRSQKWLDEASPGCHHARMHRPIIFDFDGTIVDSEPLANRGLAEVLTELGFPTSYDEALATYVGLRMVDCVSKVARIHGRKPPDSFADLCRARVSELIDKHLQPVPGAIPFVRARAESKIAIASSSRVVSIQRSLARVGLTGVFDGRIFSAADLERGKPHPDIFLAAAEALTAPPSDCLAIEDSVLGVRSAVAAGMTVIGLTAGAHCGPAHSQTLVDAGAHTTARSYDEVAAYIASA